MKLTINATSIASGNLTGIERFALRISQELCRLDRETDVLATRDLSGIPSVRLTWTLAAATRLLGSREYYARALWDQTFLRYHVIRTKPDVVFFPIPGGMLYPPVKQVVTVHDLHYLHFQNSVNECVDEIGGIRRAGFRWKMPHILRHSAAVIAVSESTKRDISNSFGISLDRIHVVPNGYDEERFRPLEDPDEVLRRLGLLKGTYFLFVGSILRHKNIVRLVQAFAHQYASMSLVIAGACKDLDYLEEVMNVSAGLGAGRVRYLDYVTDDDLPSLYSGAEAFVLPSLHEGFGVPIIEAMACGTPVITSNCSAMPEVAGDAALLVDPYSVESIASAMREILDNPQKAEALRTAGLERAKMFRWSYSAQKLYDVCKMVSEL